MLNGSTLKICFLGIVITLCMLLIVLTLGAAAGKLPIENYTRLIGILGIPALFGMICQAFIHANINSAAKEDTSSIPPPVPEPIAANTAQITAIPVEEEKKV